MLTCRICQKEFKKLKFKSDHIEICVRCVNSFNTSPEPAIRALERLKEMLARGMQRNASRDLESEDEWKRRRAREILEDFESALNAALPGWLNRLLANKENTTKDFKMMRANRRGLLRMEARSGTPHYPDNWREVARRIRNRDGGKCLVCGATEATLDVHHIIYLSRFGTNQQSNLITLCRACHESEHCRDFDFAEAEDPERLPPIRDFNKPPSQQAQWTEPLIQSPVQRLHAPPTNLTWRGENDSIFIDREKEVAVQIKAPTNHFQSLQPKELNVARWASVGAALGLLAGALAALSDSLIAGVVYGAMAALIYATIGIVIAGLTNAIRRWMYRQYLAAYKKR